MNDLPELIELFVDLALRSGEAFLAGINGFRQQRTALLDFVRVAALLQIDAFGFEEALQIVEEFVLFQCFHSGPVLQGNVREEPATVQLQSKACFVVESRSIDLAGRSVSVLGLRC